MKLFWSLSTSPRLFNKESLFLKTIESDGDSKDFCFISKNVDNETFNKSGFCLLDFIFVQNLAKLIELLEKIMKKKDMALFLNGYNTGKLIDLKILMKDNFDDIFNISVFGKDSDKNEVSTPVNSVRSFLKGDFIEDESFRVNAVFGGEDITKIYSDYIKSGDSFESESCKKKIVADDFKLEEEIYPVKRKTRVEELRKEIELLDQRNKSRANSIKKLKKRKQRLLKAIKEKRVKKSLVCFKKHRGMIKEEENPFHVLNKNLQNELLSYLIWIDSYQKKSVEFYQSMFMRLVGCLKNSFGSDAKMSKGGSFNTKLIMPWSNLNINVGLKNSCSHNMNPKQAKKMRINEFCRTMRLQEDFVDSVQVEELLAMTIVKIQLTREFKNLKIEIVFRGNKRIYHMENEDIIKEYLKHYPISQKLYAVFRFFLHYRGMDNPGEFGLNVTCIFLLIIGYIQEKEFQNFKEKDKTKKIKNFKKYINNIKNFAEVFVNFLYFYACVFDFHRSAIFTNTIERKLVSPIIKKDPSNRLNSLIILNPYNYDIILTKSFKRTKELFYLIRLSYINLFKTCNCSPRTLRLEKKIRLKKSKKHKPKPQLSISGNTNTVRVNYQHKNAFPTMRTKKSFQIVTGEFTEAMLAKNKVRNSVCFSYSEFDNWEEEKSDPFWNGLGGSIKKENGRNLEKPFFILNSFFNFYFWSCNRLEFNN